MSPLLLRWTVLLALVLAPACQLGSDGVSSLDATGNVVGVVFLDRDGDRLLDPAVDGPAARMQVTLLLQGTRRVVGRATTNANGAYAIPLVPVGSYEVSVDSTSLGDSLRVATVEPATLVVGLGDTAFVAVALDRTLMTAAAARTVPAGRRVAVEGVALNGWSTFGDSTVHVADATGSIRAVRVRATGVLAGDSVRLVARLGSSNGQPTLIDPDIVVLGTAELPEPVSIRTGAAATADGGRLDAALVRVESAAVIDARSTPTGSFRVVVDDGSGPLTIVLEAAAGITSETPLAPGTTVSVTGLLVPTRAAHWQLRPRSSRDLDVSLPTPTIAAARRLAVGKLVAIEAVALNSWGTFNDATVHLGDPTGAIRAVNVPSSFIFAGDSVRIVGTIAVLNGQPVLGALTGIAPYLLGKGRLPAPVRLSTAAASTADDGRLDAALVRIDSATVQDTASTVEGLLAHLDDGSGPVEVVIDAEVSIPFGLFSPGSTLNVVGVLVPRPGGRSWAIKPRSLEDVSRR